MKNAFPICIAAVFCFIIYFAATEEQIKMKQRHEYIMRRMELDQRLKEDSLMNEYEQNIKEFDKVFQETK